MTSKLTVVPIDKNSARAFVEEHHSHHHAPKRAILAAAVELDGRVVCVGLLERPKARLLSGPRSAEITRIASDGTTKNAASMCIAALSRAAVALGYDRIISYTLLGEAGTSYRAAGWHPAGLTDPREWSRPKRARASAVQPGAKVRWEFGPGSAPTDDVALVALTSSVGKVELRQREDDMPLFRGEEVVIGRR